MFVLNQEGNAFVFVLTLTLCGFKVYIWRGDRENYITYSQVMLLEIARNTPHSALFHV